MKIDSATGKTQFLYRPAPLKGLRGGRGSAKSVEISDAINYYVSRPWRRPLRVLCGREFQNSIEESSKKLIESRLEHYGIINNFEITKTKIIHKKYKNEIFFKGLSRNTDSIKSLEGINILWIEEAQTLTMDTLEVVMPSIRGSGAEIWCSWNPQLPSDAVERLFAELAPEGTKLVTLNWQDNKYFPEPLRLQMEKMREYDYDKYLHIWEGHYKSQSNRALFTFTSLLDSQKRNPQHLEAPIIAALDVAREGDDKSVLVVRRGNMVIGVWEWSKIDLMELAAAVADLVMSMGIEALAVDTVGVGGGAMDRLKQLVGGVCRLIEFKGNYESGDEHFVNLRAQCYFLCKAWVESSGKLPDNKALIDDLSTMLYDYNSNSQHLIVDKKTLKKLTGKSPDYADAFSMTFMPALARKRESKHERQRIQRPSVFVG